MTKITRNDEVILRELQAAVQARHEAVAVQPAPVVEKMAEGIKALQAELSAYITQGAEACPVCGNLPHGIRQDATLRREKITLYEVGCLTDANRRAQGMSRSEAVERWNNGQFIKSG